MIGQNGTHLINDWVVLKLNILIGQKPRCSCLEHVALVSNTWLTRGSLPWCCNCTNEIQELKISTNEIILIFILKMTPSGWFIFFRCGPSASQKKIDECTHVACLCRPALPTTCLCNSFACQRTIISNYVFFRCIGARHVIKKKIVWEGCCSLANCLVPASKVTLFIIAVC